MELNKLPFVEYNRANNNFAKENRKNPTLAEKIIRDNILKDRPLGYKFTRQKPIGSFIVDFYCSKLLLAIEIDGSSHNDKINYDGIRDLKIGRQSIKTIRYYNNDILKNIQEIYDDIINQIKLRESEL